MSGSSIDTAYICLSEGVPYTEDMASWGMVESDSHTNVLSQNVKSESHSNVFSQNENEEDLPAINIKKVMETFNKYKSKLKKNQTSSQINENALKDLKDCQTSLDKAIVDVLRIFGRSSKNGQEIMYLTGALSNVIREERELEETRLQSLQDEMSKDNVNLTTKMGECSNVIRECMKELSEEERVTFQNPALCGICVENSVRFVFVPCGHTICEGCKSSLHGYNCHVCRKYIEKTVKIFFS